MNTVIIYLTIICLLLASRGCPKEQGSVVCGRRSVVEKKMPYRQRHVFYVWGKERLARYHEIRPQESYVFYEWNAEETKGAPVLKDGYGMMIFYEGWRPDAAARFELYGHDRGTIIRTTSLSEFKRELSRIAPGRTLCCFNACCGGTQSGLDRAIIEETAAFCHASGIVFVEGDDEVICTCA